MIVKIVNKSGNPLPRYQTNMSAGMDLHAFIKDDMIIKPLERALVPTGLFIELPTGFEAQVRPRSGLAYKNGITLLNTPGTIDPDYRGEIKVIMINLSKDDFVIRNGDRIAQLIVNQFEKVEWSLAESLGETDRNSGGFGSTGAEG